MDAISTVINSAKARLVALFPEQYLAQAAAETAIKRYGQSVWSEERAQEAALYALEAALEYKPADKKDGFYFLANFVLGEAAGKSRRNASEDADDASLAAAFSDLNLEGEDEDGVDRLENRLDLVAFANAFDAADSGFVTTDGRMLTLSEVAEEIAAIAAEADYGQVEDMLLEWAQSAPDYIDFIKEEEVVEESCALAFAKVTKNGVTHTVLVDGRQPNYSVAYDPSDEIFVDRYQDEGDNSVLEAKGYGENGEIDELIALGPEGLMLHEQLAFGDAETALDTLVIEQPWRKVNPCVVKVLNASTGKFDSRELTAVQVYVRAYRMGLHKRIVWQMRDDGTPKLNNVAAIALACGAEWFQPALDNNQLELLDVVAEGADAIGREAYLRRIAGIDEDTFAVLAAVLPKKDEPVHSEDILRQAIYQMSLNGEMFASQAAILIAKLDGLHPQAAKRVGVAVYQESVSRKAAIGQKRISTTAEMLIAERVRPTFGYDLPKTLVAVVGNVDSRMVAKLTANLGQFAVVSTVENQQLAVDLNVRFVTMPKAEGVDVRAALAWAQGQCIAVADVVIIGKAVNVVMCEKQAEKLSLKYRTVK